MQDNRFAKFIREALAAADFQYVEKIQNLWSGYGSIDRIRITDGKVDTAIIKHIKLQGKPSHSVSFQRKLRSYQVEIEWYKNYSSRCKSCRVPKYFGSIQEKDELLIILEDLDAAGFPYRRSYLHDHELKNVLTWLAEFHATFMLDKGTDLWKVGTYWHLATRQEEFACMPNGPLKTNAHKYDEALNSAKFQTLIHGDAKNANFCFSKSGEVAAVDFQYIGRGCGSKDLAYFLWGCSKYEEDTFLDFYFEQLQRALKENGVDVDFTKLKNEWLELFPVAQNDFERFLQGW